MQCTFTMLRKITDSINIAGATAGKTNTEMWVALAFAFILLCPRISAQLVIVPNAAVQSVTVQTVPPPGISPKLPEAPKPQPEHSVNAPLRLVNSNSLIRNGIFGKERKTAASPSRHRRKFVLLQIAMMGATIADAETTLYGIRHNMAWEGNPIFGKDPSRARVYGTVMPATAFVTLLDYRQNEEDPHSRWGIIMPAIVIATHTVGMIHNLHVITK